MIGEDREEMLAAWDDDVKFDKWLKKLQDKQAMHTKSGGKKQHISQEEYLAKHARHYGGE